MDEEIEGRADLVAKMFGESPGDNIRKKFAEIGVAVDGGLGVLPPKATEIGDRLADALSLAGDQAGKGIAKGVGKGAAKAGKSIEQLASKAVVVQEAFRTTATPYMEQFADSTSQFLTSASSGFESFGDVVKDVFRNIAADMARSGIMQLLAGSFVPGGGGERSGGLLGGLLGGGGGGGGLLGGLFGGGSGGGGLFGGFFASGGRPPLGKVSVVGERGPELFVPDSAGTIIPNGGGGGGASVTVHQHFDRGLDESRLAKLAGKIKADTLDAVAEGVRRGGGFRHSLQT